MTPVKELVLERTDASSRVIGIITSAKNLGEGGGYKINVPTVPTPNLVTEIVIGLAELNLTFSVEYLDDSTCDFAVIKVFVNDRPRMVNIHVDIK